MEPNTLPQEPAKTATVCDVQFRSGSKIYFFDPGTLEVRTNDDVIIETSRGAEFGHCVRGNHGVIQSDLVAPLRPVIRLATAQDKKLAAELRLREKHAYQVCLQKIADLGLDMQLVSAECAFDSSKILFFFTADGRVDFRELVKNLASVLRTRIELRQIGVRDKAKMVGGLGICGRPFCCGAFLNDFHPVSIKMAKTQNLSLNPAKISGTCGRLMCCLNYEQEAYEDLLKTSPKAESFVDTPDGRGTVTEVNLLRQSVRVRLEKQPDTIVCHHNCDICVIRNGKAKKTDPPIPEDYAPISGNPDRKPKEEPRLATYLEPVLIRGQAINEPAEPQEEPAKSRRRRRKPAGKKPRPEGAEQSREAQPKARPEGAQKPRAEGAQKPRPEGQRPQKPRTREPGEPRKEARPPRPEGSRRPPRTDRPRATVQVEKPAPAEGTPRAKPQHRRYHKHHPRSGGPQEGGEG